MDRLTNVNGTLFFQARISNNNRELWRSDGTKNGTFMAKDIYPGDSPSRPFHLMEFQGDLLFTASDGIIGDQIWRSST
ncbi:hyalin, partial [Pseudomonas fluorescens]